MCRLFGMLAPEPTTARFWLIGAPGSMVEQSYGNPHGTGLAYYEDGRPIMEKHPIAAHQDWQFAAEARHVHSHLFVAHVRYATHGKPRLENTHPFTHSSLIFAHNGTIEGLKELCASLGPFRGDTDSERYFALLRHHIREAPDALTGIRQAVGWIKENCAYYTSLNFLLADGDSLYALRFPRERELHLRRLEAEEDFQGQSSYGSCIECRHRAGAILFASEEIAEEIDPAPSSWRALEPGTLAVARPDLRLELHHV